MNLFSNRGASPILLSPKRKSSARPCKNILKKWSDNASRQVEKSKFFLPRRRETRPPPASAIRVSVQKLGPSGLSAKTRPFSSCKRQPQWKFAYLLIWRNLSVKWRKIFILLAEAPFSFMVTLTFTCLLFNSKSLTRELQRWTMCVGGCNFPEVTQSHT